MRHWSLIALFLAIFASSAFAQGETNIRNVCDTLPMSALGGTVELVSLYYEESNWYGNPKTMVKDSSSVKRFMTYSEFDFKGSDLRVPLSITASCAEGPNSNVKYATWNSNKKWVVKDVDDYFTYIVDTHNMTTAEINENNAYNMLILHKGDKPDDDNYGSDELFVSRTFEFGFEWWLAEVSYTYEKDTIVNGEKMLYIGTPYANAIAMDSAKAVAAAMSVFTIPDTINSILIRTVKATFIDPRKDESSSSEQQDESSSSEQEVAASSAEQSVESASSSSTQTESASSSSKDPESASSSSTKTESASSSSKEPETASSSSGQTEVKTSSSTVKSSSSKISESSSSVASSSSKTQEYVSSSSEKQKSESSSSKQKEAKSSSSKQQDSKSSSSSKKADAIPVLQVVFPADVDWSTAQVRRLDGSVVQNGRQLPPGVYYMKAPNGMWKKTAVLSD